MTVPYWGCKVVLGKLKDDLLEVGEQLRHMSDCCHARLPSVVLVIPCQRDEKLLLADQAHRTTLDLPGPLMRQLVQEPPLASWAD